MFNKAKLTKRESDIVENIRKEYEEHDSNLGKEIWYAYSADSEFAQRYIICRIFGTSR